MALTVLRSTKGTEYHNHLISRKQFIDTQISVLVIDYSTKRTLEKVTRAVFLLQFITYSVEMRRQRVKVSA